MKYNLKYIILYAFLGLYGIHLNPYNIVEIVENNDSVNFSSEVSQIKNYDYSSIYCDTSQNYFSVQTSPIFPVSTLKNQINDFHFFILLSQKSRLVALLQYEIFSKYLMKRFRETDIIFPFHFFL